MIFNYVTDSTEKSVQDLKTGEVNPSSNLSKQLCRSWLKYRYLNLGQGCIDVNCERSHSIDEMHVGTLYKVSFTMPSLHGVRIFKLLLSKVLFSSLSLSVNNFIVITYIVIHLIGLFI